MSLTLQFEDELPDLFVTRIMSELQPHELVYHLNNTLGVNYQKEKKAFKITRKRLELNFMWFTHNIDEETEHFFIHNIAYLKQAVAKTNSLFAQNEEIETQHYLLPGSKKFNFLLLTLNASDEKKLQQLQKKRVIGNFDCLLFADFKKLDQNILQNIYYEK